MKYELRNIDPVSAGKLLIVVGTVVGLVVGFLFMVVIWAVGGIAGLDGT